MSQTMVYGYFGCEGSSALKPSYRELVLVDGRGSTGVLSGQRRPSRAQSRPAASERPERLALGQLALSLGVGAALVIALCMTFLSVSSEVASRQASALESIPATSVVVHGGDSVWSLAEAHPVDGYSTQEVVTWIESHNQLGSATIQAGQTLDVPEASSAAEA